MIALIRRFLDWLERRFPAKAIVTRKDYERMTQCLADMYRTLDTQNGVQGAFSERISGLEKSVNAIKDALSRGQIPIMNSKEHLRDQFIKGDFQRGPDRATLEAKS